MVCRQFPVWTNSLFVNFPTCFEWKQELLLSSNNKIIIRNSNQRLKRWVNTSLLARTAIMYRAVMFSTTSTFQVNIEPTDIIIIIINYRRTCLSSSSVLVEILEPQVLFHSLLVDNSITAMWYLAESTYNATKHYLLVSIRSPMSWCKSGLEVEARAG